MSKNPPILSPFLKCMSVVLLNWIAICKAQADVQWIRPSVTNTRPVWGIEGGISVGLWPTNGPRGLIRIYAPYLHREPGSIVQFIAVEPIVGGVRGLSEMERSHDGHPGKMMWTANEVDLAHPPAPTSSPAPGVLSTIDGTQTLSFYIVVEPYDNGARPIIKLTLRGDRPREITLQTFCSADSAPLQSCVLSATMGNMGRLRHLQLKDRIISATDLFQNAPRDDWQFFPWHQFDDLPVRDGEVTVTATGDADTQTADDVPAGWRNRGVITKQYWRSSSVPGLIGRVNGRATFWGTHANIPGGPAFENFELLSPFSQGQTFCFGVDAKASQP